MANIELFKRKVLTGLEALKAWISQNYAAKSHTHTKSEISGLVTGLTATGGSNNDTRKSYRRYSDSFTIQWGADTFIFQGGNVRSVYFMKNFLATPMVFITPMFGITQTCNICVPQVHTSHFDVITTAQNGTLNTISFMWIAIGHTDP